MAENETYGSLVEPINLKISVKERQIPLLNFAINDLSSECYKTFCDILGISDKGGKPGRFRAIQKQIYYLYKEKRQPLILTVDEAHHLNTATLNDLKMLMNFQYNSLNCFTLLRCGEPHLNHILCKLVHEALRQRITIHYDF